MVISRHYFSSSKSVPLMGHYRMMILETLSKENLLYCSLKIRFVLSGYSMPNQFWLKTKANIGRKKAFKYLFTLKEQNIP